MTQWLFTMKPSFLAEMQALGPKDAAQLPKKLALLGKDPTPDAKTKKRLHEAGGKLHRLRSGDLRIFYTFEAPYISLLAVRLRDERTYATMPEAELLGGGAMPASATAPDDPSEADRGNEYWLKMFQPRPAGRPESTALARPITKALLQQLGIEARYHAPLLAITTEEALLDCAVVPGPVLERLIDGLVGRPLDQVADQPDLLLGSTDDLLRYREGELLGFLLRLSPEQEKYVGWAMNTKGPTLLKGGPGTGKSTVALYRVRTLIEALRKAGHEAPRILFTTYTNALVQFSTQLLGSLLGKDASLVEVRTADSVVRQVAAAAGLDPTMARGDAVAKLLAVARKQVRFEGNSLQQAAQRRTLEKLDDGYLLDEILDVIEGRRLATFEAYQAAPRPGRQLGLNKTQRQAVWSVREALMAGLARSGTTTWEQLRAFAADAVERGAVTERYDAVVVDEAQDLSPAALQVLVGLCAQPSRLFLTADANQSIYGAGFTWSDVHDWLQFKGRTGVLRANHRSTREVGEAAHAYLAAGALDDDVGGRLYVHAGPLPAVRAVADMQDEAKLIARFFQGASRELRLGVGACAVLCPTNAAAQRIASMLVEYGVKASHMLPKDLDLQAPEVKTVTLKSAKGLEFPIVAVAGFLDGPYPRVPKGTSDEGRAELTSRERRTMFVAMTRAMRALLVVTPVDARSDLLQGFTPRHWNLGATS